MALDNFGNALHQVRRFDEAITAHQQAAALFTEVGDRHGEAMTLDNLDLSLEQSGRAGRVKSVWRVLTTKVRWSSKRSSAIDPSLSSPSGSSPQVTEQQNLTQESS